MKQPNKHSIFITGGSGYIGRSTVAALIKKNHSVRALVREQSLQKLPQGCEAVIGNVLDKNDYRDKIFPSDTFLHLVGVSHPGPFKAEQFRKIDLLSLQQSVEAALHSGVKHFIYLSVAHPAPVMKKYIKVREECEEIIIGSGMRSSIIRPWYVLGPGHRWPYLLIPIYKVLEKIPSIKESAKRLGLVTLEQMVQTLIYSVEDPANGIRITEVPEIQRLNYQ